METVQSVNGGDRGITYILIILNFRVCGLAYRELPLSAAKPAACGGQGFTAPLFKLLQLDIQTKSEYSLDVQFP